VTADDRSGAGRVAVLERRGKFLVAESFLKRGPRPVVSRDKRAGVGGLVLVQGGRGRGGHAVLSYCACRRSRDRVAAHSQPCGTGKARPL